MSIGQRTRKTTLPCGYIDAAGKLHTTAVVREMGWEEEMALGTAGGENPMVLIVTRCIVQVGDIIDRTEIREEVVPKMLKGDWDWLLLQIVIVTLYPKGKPYEFSFECPSCKRHEDHEYQLEEVGVREMPDRMFRLMPFTTRSGSELVFRHALGTDSKVHAEIGASDSDVMAKILAMHLVSIDGQTLDAIEGLEEGELQGMRRIKVGVKHLQNVMPHYSEREQVRTMLVRQRGGPDLGIESSCTHCGARFKHKLPVDPTLLLPSAGPAAQRDVAADF